MSDTQRLPLVVRFYQRFLRTRDTARFIHDLYATYSISTLQRLAADPRGEVRRAALMSLAHLGDGDCLMVFGKALRDPDRGVRMIADRYCRPIWLSVGSIASQQQLRCVDRLQASGRFEEGLDCAQRICQRQPEYAEGWRHAGSCLMAMEQYGGAIHHFRHAMMLNPFQFEVAISLAQCFLIVGKPLVAYRWLKKSLRIHPGLEQVRLEARRLFRATRGQ